MFCESLVADVRFSASATCALPSICSETTTPRLFAGSPVIRLNPVFETGRIIFEFVEHQGAEAILLQSIGTHDEVYWGSEQNQAFHLTGLATQTCRANHFAAAPNDATVGAVHFRSR